ncbi:MAG TPA: S8 family serine peptidase [Candidatus Limnocylindrales bacterium]|nr:S8 family serine peptidase [Candidatus Limnocylindrales bacterium]
MRRRHVATFVAAALLLSIAGPVAARGAPAGSTEGPFASAPADPAGRWIVLYKGSPDAAAATAKRSVSVGFRADRTFTNGVRGFAARLSDDQVASLRRDKAVAAVVPDEKIELQAQVNPTGISRIGARISPAALINGVDERVDADVAIVDTGIAKITDLNVVGGHDCSTSSPTRWRDVQGHGTHVAGTVGAIDNGSGVVGVAPGVRLWAVKILDDTGSGLLSWYVCGLDWILAQRQPGDPSRPRIEAVNMSVAKWGTDTPACGESTGDILHAAICRLVKDGTTVVAAAANDSGNASQRVPASYDEVITVSALADSDGEPGSLGGQRCFSWGTYDSDDTFADFSNYGADVDLIAPGKCIYSTVPGGFSYSSGTSMAAPHVTGAAALVKASRPYFTPAEVKEALQYLGNHGWKTTSDPDSTHERLLDVSRLGPRGSFELSVPGVPSVSTSGGVIDFPVTLVRDAGMFEWISFSQRNVPPGVRVTFADTSLFGFEDITTTMTAEVSRGLTPGTYQLSVVGTEHGVSNETTATFQVTGAPVAPPPARDAPPVGVADAAAPPRHVTTGSAGVRDVTGATVAEASGETAGGDAAPSGDGAGSSATGVSGPEQAPGVVGPASTMPASTTPITPAEQASSARPVGATGAAAAPCRIFLRYLFFIAR